MAGVKDVIADSRNKVSIQTCAISAVPMLLCWLYGVYKYRPWACYDSAERLEESRKMFKYFGKGLPCASEQMEFFVFPMEWSFFLLAGIVLSVAAAASAIYFRGSRLASLAETAVYPFFACFSVLLLATSVAKYTALGYFQNAHPAAFWVFATVLFTNIVATAYIVMEKRRTT